MAGGAAVEDGVEFGVQALADGGVGGEQGPGPGEGGGAGLHAGQQEGDHLVVDLAVGQAPPVLVAGAEQYGEQVLVVGAGRAVVGDQEPGDLPQVLPGAFEAAVAGGGDPVGAGQRQHHPAGDAAGDHVHGVVDGQGAGPLVRGEHAASGDGGAEAVHRGGHVDHVAVAPAGGGAGDLLGHHGGVAGQPVAVERGLEHPALAPVGTCGAGGEAVAEGLAGLLDDDAALVVRAVLGEQPAHQVGVAGDVGVERAEPQPDQVAVGGEAGHEVQRAADEGGGVTEEGERAGRGDQGVLGGRVVLGGHGRHLWEGRFIGRS